MNLRWFQYNKVIQADIKNIKDKPVDVQILGQMGHLLNLGRALDRVKLPVQNPRFPRIKIT